MAMVKGKNQSAEYGQYVQSLERKAALAVELAKLVEQMWSEYVSPCPDPILKRECARQANEKAKEILGGL